MAMSEESVRPEEYIPGRHQEINIITISDLHSQPIEIRDKLKRGEDFLVTWHKRAIFYIQHLTDKQKEAWDRDREPPEGVDEFIGIHSLRDAQRNEYLDDIREGRVYLFCVRKQVLGLLSNHIPGRAEKLFENWRKEKDAEDSRIAKEAASKRR
jgi:hypothetical protein